MVEPKFRKAQRSAANICRSHNILSELRGQSGCYCYCFLVFFFVFFFEEGGGNVDLGRK